MNTTTDLLDTLDLRDEVRTRIHASITNYQRHARVLLRIDTVNERLVWCTVHQYETPANGMVLNEVELLERGTAAFEPLLDAGYEPVICVYELEKGTPEKPRTKYRMGLGMHVLGQRVMVVRQKAPRMLLTLNGLEWGLLAMETEVPKERALRYIISAKEYWKRDHYRRQL
ncbi:MAG: hypothetical protein H6592_10435 [Flavobacteriales bacterium]|nr:hypothetical protein [Flavobacteriales bacterium]